jgi:hypothetical protein
MWSDEQRLVLLRRMSSVLTHLGFKGRGILFPRTRRIEMTTLSDHILTALDDPVAQEVGARLRQAAVNIPAGSGAPVLPDHFAESFQRLKTLHTQAKVVVDKVFGGEGGAISTRTALNFSALQSLSGGETPDGRSPKKTAGREVQKREANGGGR